MVVLGVSLGAATEIEAAAQMPDVGAMGAASAFAELHPVLDDRLKKDSPLPRLFDWGIVTGATLFFDIDPDLRPVDAVRALPHRAFLFIQANHDDWFPDSNARELYQASADPQSQLLIIDAPAHAKAYLARPAAYMSAVYSFIDAQLAAHGG